MAQILILLGGNMGNVKNTFHQAITLLSQKLNSPVRSSSIYVSEAWGFESKDRFFNQLLEFGSSLQPHAILSVIQNVEKELGRVRSQCSTYQSRPIDIDILFIDEMQLSDPVLTIPHPLLHLRRFTLKPLMEHWADKLHPVLNQSVLKLYEQCPDHSMVEKDE